MHIYATLGGDSYDMPSTSHSYNALLEIIHSQTSLLSSHSAMSNMRCPSGAVAPVSVLVVAAICLCLYVSTDLPERAVGSWPWAWRSEANDSHIKQTPELSELARVLKKAAMDNNTVIITTLNEAWAAPNSILDLFLESFRIGDQTKRLLKHLVIIAMDQKAMDRCTSLECHCFHLKTEGIDYSTEKRFMSKDYLKWMWMRIEIMRSVLELGYNFVFTDTDIMWLRDPFLRFSASADLTTACDFFRGSSSNCPANVGFLYVKSNEQTIEFYKYWYMARRRYPGRNEQDIFNRIKNDKFAQGRQIKIAALNTAYFGGFCQPSKDLNKVCTMHANCCVGLDRKIHDLRILLEDWRNYTNPSTKERKLRAVSWRVPIQCKM